MKKRRYASANLLIVESFKKMWAQSHTNHCLVTAVIHGFTMMSHVFVLLLYPLQDISRGVSRATGHTHSCLLCANHGSRRQPSFSCQGWKQNRWEMKCWDRPDLVDDCRLNSRDWNWAFYTLAAAQDTICPSVEDEMAESSTARPIGPVSWEISYPTLCRS